MTLKTPHPFARAGEARLHLVGNEHATFFAHNRDDFGHESGKGVVASDVLKAGRLIHQCSDTDFRESARNDVGVEDRDQLSSATDDSGVRAFSQTLQNLR